MSSGSKRRLGAVFMASGTASRFGTNKLLVPFEGRPLFEWAFEALPRDLFERVLVVTPYPLIAQAAARRGFAVMHNGDPEAGQSRTIRLAMQVMAGTDGCLFCVCDQPYTSAATIRRLVSRFSDGITAVRFGDTRGNPVLFASRFYHELASLDPRKTGSAVIRAHLGDVSYVAAECSLELADVDTIEEMHALSGVRSFFLTGSRGAGKSRLLMEALQNRGLSASGFQTLPYEIAGSRGGHYLHALSEGIDSEMNNKPISVFLPPDRCIPIPQTFLAFGTEYAESAVRDDSRVVLCDELGVIENDAEAFQNAVIGLLNGPKPVIGALKDADAQWLNAIRSRPDTRIVRVQRGHWEEAKRQLDRFLDHTGLQPCFRHHCVGQI